MMLNVKTLAFKDYIVKKVEVKFVWQISYLNVRVANQGNYCLPKIIFACMSRKGPKVGQEMLDFVEDCCIGVKSH